MYIPEAHGVSPKLAIVLVEDNPADVVLFRQILRRSSVDCSLTVFSDGATVVERLKERLSRPDVIFLDLDLPYKSGAEIVKELKQDLALATIPTAVLTGSDDARDRHTCATIGVDRYFSKAAVLQDFFALTAEIGLFLRNLRPRYSEEAHVAEYPSISAACTATS